jgi:Histidine kinase-, DNA gyrase B-, and HSP90-like ATPase
MHLQAKPGQYVAINVTDSGTGIPSAILDKIFEPFFTTKEVGKGTGLGLSTVLAIVKSHHGFVSAYSESGKGTTFKVYFPAMEGCLEVRKEVAEVAGGLSGNGGATKVSGAGVNHFLTKPYTAGTLLKSIRAILDEA